MVALAATMIAILAPRLGSPTSAAEQSAGPGGAAAPARKWLKATAYAIPKETAPEGEGYFSIVPGLDGRLYIGTHANAVNAWLVEFDPPSKSMKVVVDAHKAIGTDLKGFGAQSKIHTRNNVGESGKIYFGTKQGYPAEGEKREDYPGGYPMVYDPKPARPRFTRSPSPTTASTASRLTSPVASPTFRPAPTTAPAPARTRSFSSSTWPRARTAS